MHDGTIGAVDGVIGHVKDLHVDDEIWAVRYLVVDPSNGWVGHQMLLAPPWIDNVCWNDRTVSVNLTRDAIKNAAVYDAGKPLSRSDATELHAHDARTGNGADRALP